MKNWFRRFFFFLGLASFTFLLMRFLELLRNGGELVFTASLLGGGTYLLLLAFRF